MKKAKIDTWITDNIRYVTIKDFSQYIGVSRQTIYNWIYRGMLAVKSENGRFLILLDDAVGWISQNR